MTEQTNVKYVQVDSVEDYFDNLKSSIIEVIENSQEDETALVETIFEQYYTMIEDFKNDNTNEHDILKRLLFFVAGQVATAYDIMSYNGEEQSTYLKIVMCVADNIKNLYNSYFNYEDNDDE